MSDKEAEKSMSESLTYEEAIAYIHGRYRFRIKLGLERMRYLLEKLGNPHRQFPWFMWPGPTGKVPLS